MRISAQVLQVAVVLSLATAFAPQRAPAADREPLTVDDIIYMESATAFDISPDGRWVVWVKTTAIRYRSRSPSTLGSPLFSPGSQALAFAA